MYGIFGRYINKYTIIYIHIHTVLANPKNNAWTVCMEVSYLNCLEPVLLDFYTQRSRYTLWIGTKNPINPDLYHTFAKHRSERLVHTALVKDKQEGGNKGVSKAGGKGKGCSRKFV